ncbi:MAG: glycosyltransferase family 4 protein [Candidatus Bathyarchaeia archaeon]
MARQILFIVPAYPPYFIGGAQAHAKAIVDFLVERNNRVTVLTTQARSPEDFWSRSSQSSMPIAEESVIRWPIKYLPFHRFILGVFRLLAYKVAEWRGPAVFTSIWGHLFPWVPGFAKYAVELAQDCDIVQVMDMSYDAIWCAGHQAALKAQKPLLLFPLLNLGDPKSKIAVRHLLPHKIKTLFDAQAVVVQTPTEKAFWRSLGIDERRLYVVGAGVNLREVTGGSGRRFRIRFGLRADVPVVGFLGPFNKDKGVYDLIKAARILWAQGVDFDLVIAGIHQEKRVTTLSGETRLHLIGPLDEEGKRDFLDGIDILAMPSRVESFGLVYLEAWANGKPVIGAYAGGVPDVITDGIDGILVPFGNPIALSEALQSLLQDRERATRMGRVGFDKVVTHFTWDKIFQRLEVVYENILMQ